LGAQQLKTQFATRRITKAQKDVAKFARDLLRLRGAVMARHFSPSTLALMSGLPETMPALPPPPPMLVPAPMSPIPGGPVGAQAGLGAMGAAVGGAPQPAPAVGGRPPAPAMPGGPAAPPMAGGAGVPGRPGAPVRPLPAGARLAPDGRHYLPDPRRPGKYLMVA
jgi:hypothetical protein